MNGNSSDVAWLRQQIELTCQAFNLALTGYAITARHDIISNRYRQLDDCREQLARHVGEQAALEITVDAYNRIVK